MNNMSNYMNGCTEPHHEGKRYMLNIKVDW